MSLRSDEYDLSKVRNCNPVITIDDGISLTKEPTPTAVSLIRLGNLLWLPSLSARTVSEWWFRLLFLERIGWKWFGMEYTEKDGVLHPVYPTYQDLVDHFGLRVNTNRIERVHWTRHMTRRIENAVLRSIEKGDANA